MKVPVGNVPQIITEYFETCIFPAAAKLGGATPFLVAMSAGLLTRKAPALIEQYGSLLQSLGLVDSENQVDADLLYEEAVKALEKHPVVICGYRPDRGDLDQLKKIMEKYGV